MKKYLYTTLLFLTIESFVQPISKTINKDLSIDFYKEQTHKDDLIAILQNFYQLADDVKNELNREVEAIEPGAVDFVLLNAENTVIGCSCFDMNKETLDAHIYMIAVAKECRRKGFAENFLLKHLEFFKECGIKSVSLRAHPIANGAAIRLYKKIGFQSTGINSDNGLEEFSLSLA